MIESQTRSKESMFFNNLVKQSVSIKKKSADFMRVCGWIDWKRVVIAFKLKKRVLENLKNLRNSVQRYRLLEILPGNRR